MQKKKVHRILAPRPKVYLAGPIKDCTDAEAGDWRKEATEKLAEIGYDVLDPFKRDYRGVEDNHWQEIVEGDKHDIEAADYIIANCPKASAGTSMEIYLSWEMGKAPIVIAPKPVSPWVRYHAADVVDSLDEAIMMLKIFGSRKIANK